MEVISRSFNHVSGRRALITFLLKITTRNSEMRFSILECPWHHHSHPKSLRQKLHRITGEIDEQAVTQQPVNAERATENLDFNEQEKVPSLYALVLEQTVRLFCLSLLG